ncbi:hypothetical protein HYX07_03285 [Candidatus Woesearchaeota archaeon]|nr:hypothetical protein [Candidatus Woesearchaeota archaeon]
MKLLNLRYVLDKEDILLLLPSIAMSVLISYGFYFFIWIAFVPLIYMALKKDYRKMFLVSLVYGIITSTMFFSWVYNIKLNYDAVLYTIIILIFTAYFMLFLTSVSFLSKKIKSMYVVLLPPVVWIIILFAYSLLPIEIYWMDFSIFQPDTAPLIWYLGSYGITFIVLLFNSTVAHLFIKRDKRVMLFGIFIFIIVATSIIYSNYSQIPQNGGKVKVALLQGNFPYEWEWRQENAFGTILDTYLNMTLQAAKEKPYIIIWPEYALPDDITRNAKIFTKLQKTAQAANATLIIGSISYIGGTGKYEDTAFVLKPDGSLDSYSSVKPFFLDGEVVRGNSTSTITQNDRKFGIIICNEESMPYIARGYTSKGSQFIVSMSNNQDFGRGRNIISQFTKLRAAENAKYVLRATNDGITQIINPFGKAVYVAEPKKQKILIGDIYLNDYPTFYTKHGNTLVYLLVFLSIILVIKKRQYGNYH